MLSVKWSDPIHSLTQFVSNAWIVKFHISQVYRIYKNPDENPLRRGLNSTACGSSNRQFLHVPSFDALRNKAQVEEENQQLREEVETVRF